jgi:hypothetical protein
VTARVQPAPAAGHRPDIQEILDASARLTGSAANINLTLARHPGLFRHFAGFYREAAAGREASAA